MSNLKIICMLNIKLFDIRQGQDQVQSQMEVKLEVKITVKMKTDVKVRSRSDGS